jgi:hypothetical protein
MYSIVKQRPIFRQQFELSELNSPESSVMENGDEIARLKLGKLASIKFFPWQFVQSSFRRSFEGQNLARFLCPSGTFQCGD